MIDETQEKALINIQTCLGIALKTPGKVGVWVDLSDSIKDAIKLGVPFEITQVELLNSLPEPIKTMVEESANERQRSLKNKELNI